MWKLEAIPFALELTQRSRNPRFQPLIYLLSLSILSAVNFVPRECDVSKASIKIKTNNIESGGKNLLS